MDPITLALAGLNMAGAGYNYYEGNRMGRLEDQYGRAQAEAGIRGAQNQRAQYEDDLRRRRRMLAESLAARGVEDSTISTDENNYLNQGADRTMSGLNDNVNLAQRGLQLQRRRSSSRRRGNAIGLGLGLANALGGAYGAMNSAPGVPSYGDLPFVPHA